MGQNAQLGGKMRIGFIGLALVLAGPVAAQQMDHAARGNHTMHGAAQQQPQQQAQETGQSAFAALQEIVGLLQADPDTDWSKVDIDALRQHLVDMDNVTLRAVVKTQPIKGGMTFLVSSEQEAVSASIQRMVLAHAAVMDGVDGLYMRAAVQPNGAVLDVKGDEVKIKALGFFGIMATGMHHQAHHLAIARGGSPHH